MVDLIISIRIASRRHLWSFGRYSSASSNLFHIVVGRYLILLGLTLAAFLALLSSLVVVVAGVLPFAVVVDFLALLVGVAAAFVAKAVLIALLVVAGVVLVVAVVVDLVPLLVGVQAVLLVAGVEAAAFVVVVVFEDAKVGC